MITTRAYYALVWMNYFVHDAKLKFELFSQSTDGNRMIEHIYFLSSPIHYHSFSGHNTPSRVKLTLVMKIALEPTASSNSLAPLHSLVQQVPAYLAQITFWGHYFLRVLETGTLLLRGLTDTEMSSHRKDIMSILVLLRRPNSRPPACG